MLDVLFSWCRCARKYRKNYCFSAESWLKKRKGRANKADACLSCLPHCLINAMYLFNLLECSFWVLFTINFTRLINFSLVPVILISMFFPRWGARNGFCRFCLDVLQMNEISPCCCSLTLTALSWILFLAFFSKYIIFSILVVCWLVFNTSILYLLCFLFLLHAIFLYSMNTYIPPNLSAVN